jgi:hypothetical protein
MMTDEGQVDVLPDVLPVAEPLGEALVEPPPVKPPPKKKGRPKSDKPKIEAKVEVRKKITPSRPPAPLPTPWTVTRLEALRHGERFCFYRGNLQADYGRALSLDKGGTPGYAFILQQIMEAVARLRIEQRIDVSETKIGTDAPKGEGKHQLFEYVAIGRAGN